MIEKVYVNKIDQASELKSSAYMLIIMGVIGGVCVLALVFDYFPIRFTITSKIIIGTVLGILFGFFIIMGFKSAKSYKQKLHDGLEEKTLSQAILQWCISNITIDNLEKKVVLDVDEEGHDEILYYKRIELIKEQIEGHFMNVEETLLDELIDDFYCILYAEKE